MISFSTAGAVIASRGSSKTPIGWLFCATGLLFGITTLAAQYAIYTLIAAPGSLPAGNATAWITSWLPYLGLGFFVLIFLLFPDGRLLSDRWRWFARLSALLTLVAMVLAAFSPGRIDVLLPFLHNPLGIEGLPNAYKPLQVLMIVLTTVAAGSLWVRWVHARGVVRQQIKWFSYAIALSASGAILQYAISEPLEQVLLGWVGRTLVLAGLAGIPISMGIAITRYRLFDIDVIINRTLVYGALTASLALVYFGGVTATQTIFRTLTGQQQQPQLAIVVSTLVIAALFMPLRRRIQGFIDRRFYRRKYDAAKTLEAFSAKLRDETDLEALSDDLVGVVRETMQPAHVSLWLRSDPVPQGGERATNEPSG